MINYGHANGVTYYDNYLYVAPIGEKVYKVSRNGDVIAECKADKRIISIAHYKDEFFFGSSNDNQYYLMKLDSSDPNNIFFNTEKTFTVSNSFSNYDKSIPETIPQTIYYENNTLYIISTDKSMKKNHIRVAKFHGDIVDGNTYPLYANVVINSNNNRLFEVESMFIYDGKIYFCTNGTKETEGIYAMDINEVIEHIQQQEERCT